MNLIQLIDCWRADDEFSWNNFYFTVVKELWYGKKYLKSFLQVFFWILLWMLTSFLIWNLNIFMSTTLKYCYKWGAMRYFPKKLLGHEILGPWSKTLRPPSCILNVCCLIQKPILKIFINFVEMLKETTIHFCLFDEIHFSNICIL